MRTIEFSGIEPSQAFLYMDDLIKNLKTYLAWTQVYWQVYWLPYSKKDDLIEKDPVLTDADSARRFVAFCSYYRRFT